MPVFSMENITKDTEDENEKPLVMLVDDEIENINVLRQLLESHFQIITGLNGAEALKMIDNMVDPKQIQLIISDQRMPKVTGVEFLEQIVDRMPDTIRIILTGYSDTQVIIDAINKAKLYKFMTKPFDPVELSLTVQRGIEAYQMRKELIEYSTNLEVIVKKRTIELHSKNEELNEALDALEKQSLTDQLTGIHNRHFLTKFMPQEVARLNRTFEQKNDELEQISLMMVDIDFFKQVNDDFSHDAGDKVLVKFAHLLVQTCRESDWVIRWGGEEFVIIARGLPREDTENLAERICKNIAKAQFDIGLDKTISITCSIGIASFPFMAKDHKLLTWQQTLNFADTALYIAKNNGRNAWVSLSEKNVEQPVSLYKNTMEDIKHIYGSGDITIQHSSSIEPINL
ncbi:MAG: diguanylate cyclase [Colwellia sp.]|nr:diguanylate cyclase [Colwellia sp.]